MDKNVNLTPLETRTGHVFNGVDKSSENLPAIDKLQRFDIIIKVKISN